ncbi:MAG: hypothetical protein LBG63_00290 [Candidatus Methanoplasma sp.]|nr:hypothetical protein [Candidatus Methanoplasma sp.]
MANEIEIAENKTLKLNRVIFRELRQQDNNEVQKALYMLSSFIKSKKLTPYGPTIVHSKTIFENMRPIQITRIMVQLRESLESVNPPYAFEESIRVENCILARYRGDAARLQIAYGKIQVYAFEKDIHLKDEMYTVLIEETPSGLLADVFAETVK